MTTDLERARSYTAQGDAEVLRYLNRRLDRRFILRRGANRADEPLWEPSR